MTGIADETQAAVTGGPPALSSWRRTVVVKPVAESVVSTYSVLVFLHIVGALGLFASIGLEQVGVYRLRRARTGAQVNEWVSTLAGLRRIDAPAGLLLLATGMYLMVTRWGHQWWAAVAVAGMVGMALLGILVTGRRLRPIKWEATGMIGAIPSELSERLRDPVLLTSATVRAAIGVAIVFNMVTKPSVGPALAALIVMPMVGALVAQLAAANVKMRQVWPASS